MLKRKVFNKSDMYKNGGNHCSAMKIRRVMYNLHIFVEPAEFYQIFRAFGTVGLR